MKKLLTLALVVTGVAGSQSVKAPPANFMKHKQEFIRAKAEYWDSYTFPEILAGCVHQETCINKYRCWNPTTELKTDHEYGFGLGQITIIYRKDGSERMNIFKDLKARCPKLKDWKWEDRYDTKRQLIAMMFMHRQNWNRFSFITDSLQRSKAMLSAYNGGAGSVMLDRAKCRKEVLDKSVCDSWDGGIADHTYKSKKSKGPQYGNTNDSAINRSYPQRVVKMWSPIYKPHLKVVTAR